MLHNGRPVEAYNESLLPPLEVTLKLLLGLLAVRVRAREHLICVSLLHGASELEIFPSSYEASWKLLDGVDFGTLVCQELSSI